jgi:hypothetical protein
MVFKLVWGLASSCCRTEYCFLLWPDSGHSGLQLSQHRDVAVRVDGLFGLRETQEDPLFIPWEYSCAEQRETWRVSHINIAIAETHHAASHSAHIHCLASASVDEYQLVKFFSVEELNDTALLRTHFHVRRHFARILCCHLSHCNNTYKLLTGRFNLYCHTIRIRL